jgi:hypothetical protein
MATEIEIYGERVTLERVYTKADRQYGFKSSADYLPEYEKSTEYDVLIDGQTVGRIFAYSSRSERRSSSGRRHIVWQGQMRKQWGYCEANSWKRGKAYLPTRKTALQHLIRYFVLED